MTGIVNGNRVTEEGLLLGGLMIEIPNFHASLVSGIEI